jgi:fatty-acid desaturase
MFLETVDEHNFYKAVMGLYLGFSTVWVLGVFKANYLKIALITNIVFMLGLGFGRLLSIALDGIPTFGYLFGTVAELFLGFYGLWVLNSKN